MYRKYETLLQRDGVTTYKVCKSTGLEKSMFTRWKNGDYTPKVDKLMVICKYFDVPIEFFLEDDEGVKS